MADNATTLTLNELNALAPDAKAQVKALFNLRQALFDILGAYPQDNVLPYTYALSNTVRQGNAIAANQTVQNSIKISADSAFVANDVRGRTTGDLLIFVRQDASDRQLFNTPIHSSTYLGTAQRPGPLRKPWLLPANTTVSYDLADISGLQNEAYISLSGFKVYNRSVQ